MSIPYNIIVNADDFGYSQNVNEAITEAFTLGYINQTTLMVNMPAASSALILARKNGFFNKIGLHLNLTEGTPITSGMKQCDLFCEDGLFKGNIRSLVKKPMKRMACEILKDEIKAQIERYLEFGLPLCHLDSHHHVHTELLIFRLIESVLSKESTDFRSIRIARNLCGHKLSSLPKTLYKHLFNLSLKKHYNVTDYFGSYQDFIDFKTIIRPGKTCEIMVHPVLADGILMDKTDGGKLVKMIGHYDYEREQN